MSETSFQHIVLMGRAGVRGVPETLLALIGYLQELNVDVSIEAHTASLLDNPTQTIVDADAIPDSVDLIIVVGGDGSLLGAARVALQADLPVLGINRGHLGFLTDIRPDQISKIKPVLQGFYRKEERLILSAELFQQDTSLSQHLALNDVVLSPGDSAQMIKFDIYIDEQFVCQQRADGLIIATPTGSTAYSLSGGGPILKPGLNAVVLVPMFPHTLSNRPIVISANSRIDIIICDSNETQPYISCDALSRSALAPGGHLTITQHETPLRLIHPEDYNYYTTLREKLGWQRNTV